MYLYNTGLLMDIFPQLQQESHKQDLLEKKIFKIFFYIWLISISKRNYMISLPLPFEEVLILYQYSEWVKRMNWVSTVK